MTQIYGIAGLPLSGKTTVADKMDEEGYKKIDMGDVVREEMDNRDIPTEETGEFVSDLRDKNGMTAIAELTLPYVEEAVEEHDRIVISGMRGWNEKECFENNLDTELEIIAVWASRNERKKREEARAREEDKVAEIADRDEREIRHGAAKLVSLADHMIVNENLSLKEFEEKIEDNLQELRTK